ncbi:hypothetical protein [Streptomyces sp. S.PNR 29]|uniref:HD domain-containing protein n=1 Tax=Streptomyces sp. S.PNR 29 TaxID=2973805 RepID=UPI0025AFCA64|nr:hypothetical protein [Streptomyces sp. S.PNR 29]MDN0194165.1 hypothetical protein [Streptomyces sp. S.PNR 29]
MARYKALLIGVSQYGAPGISPLPFVPDDLDRMTTALKTRGFHKVHLAQSPYFSPNVINGEVTAFLAAAGPGDRLLIVLSGHGVHSGGKDYLVPEDFRPELSPFTGGCVEIDWRGELENSRADQVVFLVDTCREGFQEAVRGDEMGLSKWPDRKIARTLRRKVAYVFACSQAETARYVRETDEVRNGHDVGTEPGDTFSLFSRTVTELLAGPVSTLGEFRPAAQERVDALHEAYGKRGRPQHVRVLTEEDHDTFVLFPPPESTVGLSGAERTWAETVTSHPAWNLTAPARAASVEVLRTLCGHLASRYARACADAEPQLANDPWYDRNLAERVTERVGFLLLRLAEGTELSPTEAALLALLPFAAQTHWVRQTVGQILPTAELDGFLASFPRLARRLRTLEQNPSRALDDIRWWGYHRWLVRHPDAFGPAFLPAAAPQPRAMAPAWAVAELSADRLVPFIKEQRIAPSSVPGTTRSTALQEERQVAPSTPHEHAVRDHLVSALFKVAHALAIDPADLPEVLVEHLGISDSVRLDDLRATLHQAHWLPSGAGRSLSALCDHPAVELALKRHAETVDILLRDINKESVKRGSSLAPLASLPAYADAQQVRPSGAAPAELSSGIKFRLADDRVQELLMGEQLYGDRALAIRELYQNALDALRYREARTEYLRRTGVPVPDWRGEVVFTEGVDDDGRPYLECADNGIGMGVAELSRAFAQGGSRFVDLPEYLEEGALWASLDPPIELVPVSRFGLGVLSYFMIADELTVLTCRLDREGRPGHLLKVTIAGPGNLFRVEDLGPGREAGTRVRLHSVPERPIPSSGEELGKYLWVSPYRVSAPGREAQLEWAARELVGEAGETEGHVRVPGHSLPGYQSSDDATPYVWSSELGRQPFRTPQRGPAKPAYAVVCRQDGVWWTDGSGAVLVDGIANDTALFGRVVDLSGSEQATLSVDRKKLRSYDARLVHDRCLAAVDDLIDAPGLLSPAWLDRLLRQDAELAEAIALRAAERAVVWTSYTWKLDVSRTGFFPPDLLLLPAVTGTFPWPEGAHDSVAALFVLGMPEPVLRWRLRVLHSDLPAARASVARPSDLALLCVGGRQTWRRGLQEVTRQIHEARAEPPAHLGSAAAQDRALHALAQLRGLLPRWRPAHTTVEQREVLVTAAGMGRSPAQVSARLTELGYSVGDLGPLAQATVGDLPLLAVRRSLPPPGGPYRGQPSPHDFLVPGACIPLAHLYLQDDPVAAARRLQELGYVLPPRAFDVLLDRGSVREADLELARDVMCHRDAIPATASDGDRITRGQLLFAAALSRSSPDDVAKRLTELGFVVPHVEQHVVLTPAHHRVASLSIPAAPSGTRSVRPADVLLWPVTSPELQAVLADFGVTARPAAREPETPVITAVHLRAAALSGIPLAALEDAYGADVPDHPAHDELLVRAFQDPATLPPHPGRGSDITLAEIASAALRVRRPFREVAARATELGFTHDAQDWWPTDSGHNSPREN